MTPHFLKWLFGPKIESVDGICHQRDSMNRFYLEGNGKGENASIVSKFQALVSMLCKSAGLASI